MDKYLRNGFTIAIPTWNRVKYIKACVDSIVKNSYFNHEIIIHINGCTDRTLEWAESVPNILNGHEFKYTFSQENKGIIYGHNVAAAAGTRNLILIADNDILFYPNWDLKLVEFAEMHHADKKWWLNCIPVEPHGNNPACIAPKNYGVTIDDFSWDAALLDFNNIVQEMPHPINSNCCPALLWRESWEQIGGCNPDLEIGIGMEDDLAFRFWRDVGCRNFVGVPGSLVYHFAAGLVGNQPCPNRQKYMNLRDQYFIEKYEMTKEKFLFDILKRGQKWKRS